MKANLAGRLRAGLPPAAVERLVRAGEAASRLGWRAWLVGGAVRDLLLGRPSLDLDVTVEGDGVALAERLAGAARLVRHRRFGTASLLGEGWRADFATARRETYPHPGALPVVSPGSLRDDLFRRDFTINAMAASLAPGSFGDLADPFGGREDLERGWLRTLHPQSFRDDPTRILRGIRYAARFRFRFEGETLTQLHQHRAVLAQVSGDRLRRELELLLKEPEPERGLRLAGELGVLSYLGIPGTGDGFLADAFARARQGESSPLLYLCLLAYAMDAPAVDAWIGRLRFPAATARALQDTVKVKEMVPRLPTLTSRLCRWLAGLSPTAIAAAALANPGKAGDQLQHYLGSLRYVKPALTGADLIGLGVAPGPGLGEVLRRLQEARWDGTVRSRRREVALVRRWLSQKRPGAS